MSTDGVSFKTTTPGDTPVTAAEPLPVTDASTTADLDAIKTSVQILDDWDETDRAKVNPIVGQAGVSAGAGTVDATTQRVVLASDGPTVPVAGNIASGSADSGNPVKVGGKYNATQPTLTDGNRGDLQVDVNGNLRVTQATLLAGENLTDNRLMVEEAFSTTSITTQTTTTVKSGAGKLSKIIIPTPVASATVKVYDNTAGSGTVLIDTITFPATLLSSGPVTVLCGQTFATGLTVVTAGATMAVDVVYI